jgi:hypothetical protein
MLDDAIFLFVAVMMVIAAAQLYSRRFSGIAQHPYQHVHSGAPGANGASRMSRSDEREINYWTRGTK